MSALIAVIAWFMRCAMASSVSASFDSSDPITSISYTLGTLWSTVHIEIQVRFVQSGPLAHALHLVRLPLEVALYDILCRTQSPATSFCSRPSCGRCPRVSCATTAVRRPRPLHPLVFCNLVVAALRGLSQQGVTMWNKVGLSFPPRLMDLSPWRLTMFRPPSHSRSRAIASVGCVALLTIASHNSAGKTRSKACSRSKEATCS